MVVRTIKLAIIFTLFLSVSCKTNKQDDNNLLGSWYFIDTKLGYDTDSVYNELFITDDYFIYFVDYHFLIPQKYKISGDSILFFYNKDSVEHVREDYIPKFKMVDNDNFKLIYQDEIKEFKRIENFTFDMEKYGNLDENTKFLKTFYKRRFDYYAKRGIKVDSVYIEEPIEEKEIIPK